MAERQTATYLSGRLAAAGLKPLSRFGQNFLTDLNLVELIARSAEITQNDVVLEIGTGVGSLTQLLAAAGNPVLTVEIDNNLFVLAGEELETLPNVKMLHMDALRNKNSLRKEIIDSVRAAKKRVDGRFMLVANLPYNVATPIISNLLLTDPPAERMVVTIQKELGDRIVAAPGNKDYGALSVWIQSQCRAEIIRTLPPTVFWPRPRVHSAIVRIDRDPQAVAKIPDLAFANKTIRALFFHRRKLLRSVMISAMKGILEKPDIDAILQQCGQTGTERAEQLSVEQIMRLVECLRVAVNQQNGAQA
ncbi:MAG: 16S rRNA (adenine(1518)-N(6)/adenine(1519)-N(6))-dimethyltransferase RsmA [Planctomycetota bacterium]